MKKMLPFLTTKEILDQWFLKSTRPKKYTLAKSDQWVLKSTCPNQGSTCHGK
jgi:hypothetical protein